MSLDSANLALGFGGLRVVAMGTLASIAIYALRGS
jgi:hypothetical protein